MSQFDLASARIRLGIAIGDLTKDMTIEAALKVALTAAENYCDRRFTYGPAEDEYFFDSKKVLQASAWPIDLQGTPGNHVPGSPSAVYLQFDDEPFITFEDAKKQYRIRLDTERGRILFGGMVHFEEVRMIYVGGFQELPADLLLALWGIFDVIYYAMLQNQVQSVAPTGVSSISIPDVGTISFNEAGSGASATTGDKGLGPLLGMYKSFLDPYKDGYVR